MPSYGYTLDHIAPSRDLARRGEIKPFPRVACAAVIVCLSLALWTGLFEVVEHIVL
jgi:hypothetical protein